MIEEFELKDSTEASQRQIKTLDVNNLPIR
jgi:hypothetical protein